MEEIIIIALILGAGYYLLTQKPTEVKTQPLTTTQSTQTEPNPEIKTAEEAAEKALEITLDELITNIRKLNTEIK